HVSADLCRRGACRRVRRSRRAGARGPSRRPAGGSGRRQQEYGDMTAFTAAVVQMQSGMDPDRNIRAMGELVREAAAQGARYVQTPEMTGALHRDRKALLASLEPASRDRVAAAASELAREFGIFLHLGSTAVRLEAERLAN